MKKNIIIISSVIAIIAIIIALIFCINNDKEKEEIKEEMNVVANASLLDEVNKNENSYWCGTMQLCWNDLVDNVAKQDIEFNPQLNLVKNLNKKSFTKENISDDDVYTFVGKTTNENKKIIEKELDKKFNEKSKLLDQIDWTNNEKRANDICYSMLKKEFPFDTKFNELEKDTFKNTANVNYFGFKANAKEKLREQVNILFYDDDDHFAIKLKTSTDDEIVFYKNPEGNTFDEMYKKIKNKYYSYSSDSIPDKKDSLKIPNITLNQTTEFYNLENKDFLYSDGSYHFISDAIQTIDFALDETGGKIKSEAVVNSEYSSAAIITSSPKRLYIDDDFAMFLIEKDKDVPYFAMYVTDITPFQ